MGDSLALNHLPQQLANGLTLGAVYALIALGYSLVYGVLRLLNFAHGELYMVGAFLGYGVLRLLEPALAAGLPGWLALTAMLLAAMVGCGLLGALIERLVYRPLRHTHRLAPLLGALGIAFVLQHGVLLLASARHRAIHAELILPASLGLELGSVRISAARLLVIGITLLLLAALALLVYRTRMGRALRAIGADPEAAAMLGVPVERVVGQTFVLGSALAGAAGVLVGLVFTKVWHLMGVAAGLKGFTAAVLGGIGSLPGALLGGLLLGIAESVATGVISPTYSDLIVFGVLIVALLVRPAGLLGVRAQPKV